MNTTNIFPLIYVILISILICSTQYYGPFANLSIKPSAKIAVQLVLFGYLVQMSSIVHELGHALVGGGQSVANIPDKFYIPYIGYHNVLGNMNSSIIVDGDDEYFRASMAGFVSQIIYLVVMGLIFFKGNPLAMSIILSGFLIYMFSYIVYMRDKGGNDFAGMACNYEY
jgi:hypothetical protein